LFGYRCEKWQPKFPHLPSQHYAFDLVERAMRRGAIIVALYKGRHNGGWLDRMPELLDCPRLHTLSSMQSAYITRRNCPGGYDEIIAAICSNGT
jgi:hypothetical protein